ncbi:Hsp70 family protein [Saccharopolyspora shandongensis]|uniref:Hsp70 family protein n=1 Tax=Saccharopolyspora shandongensis TaxID=418495 RepID=UPI0033FEAC8A
MEYQLGIDLGTTFTAAAVATGDGIEVATLGEHAPKVPSVLFLADGDVFLVGDNAQRRSVTEPCRVAREFKRRFGDPAPIILDGKPFSADGLTARLLRWTVDCVTRERGEQPSRIVVCHPANWGPYKKDLLAQVFQLADLDGVVTVTEPEAAAICYASRERLGPQDVVAVYDLGGGTFDAAVISRGDTDFRIIGNAQGIERLGGVDFDEAVLGHVARAVGKPLGELDSADEKAMQFIWRLRAECTAAKEALSADTHVVIPVLLPQLQTQVRLTREEFERTIRPAVGETIRHLRRALQSAHVDPGRLKKILLVGGSSRIPLVGRLLSEELGRPVAVDASPKYAIAEGAAIAARELESVHPVREAARSDETASEKAIGTLPGDRPVQRTGSGADSEGSPDGVKEIGLGSGADEPERPPSLRRDRKQRRVRLLAIAAAVAVLLGAAAGGGWVLLSHQPTPTPPPAPAAPTPRPAPSQDQTGTHPAPANGSSGGGHGSTGGSSGGGSGGGSGGSGGGSGNGSGDNGGGTGGRGTGGGGTGGGGTGGGGTGGGGTGGGTGGGGGLCLTPGCTARTTSG